ncbi:NADH-quinone oxidoreductase subunit L [Thermoleophilum album]|uniref:NADH-quinone oxidoreductase subunit L n=1 Tax=Thermoleophilum album TaxID=29539 RepID=A0A1H6FJN9_THEAL|nr:NADH-quinone oxidoreductase subunit L [Thermoleophilum album]SEH10612.1 NADH-quinone oxidoreductase subunit L [Thermoleophilum album]
MSTTAWGWLVLACPLAGLLVVSAGWPRWRGVSAGVVASAAILASFAASVGALLALLDHAPEARTFTDSLFTYADASGVRVGMEILVDPLSVLMCLVVSGVSFLIHLYSVVYMRSDRGYTRYFAYLNFFVFSMLLLVLAGNLVLLIVGWAFVGAASYLLISFWYRRRTATAAGAEAFVINVIGDVGLVLGAFLLFDRTGVLDWQGLFEHVGSDFVRNEGTLVAACLLLLLGAFAKSAQLPLHTWLPNAMEGPTPVSALIHAATMVTAGVYLIARAHPIFELAPTASDVAAVVGTLTLLFAASVALAVTDLKRIIAYSTMSQIGYMILGVSVAAYGAGLFHLVTHAFFKALLFMAAGSVIGAMGGIQDIDRMGGLRRAMPFTYACFVAGAVALAGLPLTSGFFSKDAILAATFERGGGYTLLGILGYGAALLTAIYAFRMVFRVFHGRPVPEAQALERGELAHHEPHNPLTGEPEDNDVGYPGPEHHVAERSLAMKAAMAPLAVLSLVAGALQIPGVTHVIDTFLEPTFRDSALNDLRPAPGEEWLGLALGAAIALTGLWLAHRAWVARPDLPTRLRSRFGLLHRALVERWYFDRAYQLVFVEGTQRLAASARRFIEQPVVEGALVGGTVALVRAGSAVVRAAQSGFVRAYAFGVVGGVLVALLWFLARST